MAKARFVDKDDPVLGRGEDMLDMLEGDIEPEEIQMLMQADEYGNAHIPQTDAEVAEFIERNSRLIHAILRPYRGLDDYDDLFQEAAIGFLKGIRTYNPKTQNKITTYAFACGRNEVKMYLRKGRAKSRSGGVTVSIEASINPEDERDNLLNKDLQSYDPLYEPEDLDESIHRNILYERAERIMKRHLNNTQQFVVRQMMNKVPQSKTAKVLKTSQSEVSKILKTSICIIRLKMQEEEESGWLSDDEVGVCQEGPGQFCPGPSSLSGTSDNRGLATCI